MEVLARILLICLSLTGSAIAQRQGIPPSFVIKKLDSLKKQDNLSDWLYRRIDYSYTNPRQSLSFLMNTEKEMWRSPKSTAEKEAWLILLSNQAYNQMYTGNILSSINCYEQAYNYTLKSKLNVEGIADYVLKPWANNYTRLGDYEKALFIQQKTLEYARKEHNDELIVSVYNNMAISYRSLGNFKKAEQCIALAKGSVKSNTKTLILLDNTLADIYNDKDRLDLAEKVIKRNIVRQQGIEQNFETAYWQLSSYITAGDIQEKKGNINEAQTNYKIALSVNEQYYDGNRLREKAYILTQLGKIRLAQQQPALAIAYFSQALAAFGLTDTVLTKHTDRIFGDNRLVTLFYQQYIAYRKLGQQKKALRQIRFSLLSADKIRFELADVKTKQRFQKETKKMAENAIATAFDLLKETKQTQYATIIVDIIEQMRARTLLDDIRRNQQKFTLTTKDPLFEQKVKLEQAIAYNEKELLQGNGTAEEIELRNAALRFKVETLEKDIVKRYPALAINNEITSTENLLKQLPAAAHFIEFFAGTDHLYIAELHHKKIKSIKRINKSGQIRKSIADFVNTYYHHGPAAMMDHPKAFYQSSHQIYNRLLSGLNFAKDEKLIVIPDEEIGYLSFDGLITHPQYKSNIADWPYLLKQVSTSYAFSVHTWLKQSLKKNRSGSTFSGLFITHQNNNRQFIPAVAKEADAIEKIVDGEFRRDKQAGVADFFKAFDKSNALHISTHAYLSGVQQEPTLAFDDNQVFLFELSARKAAPDLVVLSACRTADGVINSGEGIISFSRGFAAIGTGGTIAGLWNVNDKAASSITADCYRNMLQGQKISTALHHSKLKWLQEKQRPAQEYLPYYWDALIYMGCDRKIDIDAADNSLADYGKLCVLALTVLIVGWYLVKKKTIFPASGS